jgi:hypothetical protein
MSSNRTSGQRPESECSRMFPIHRIVVVLDLVACAFAGMATQGCVGSVGDPHSPFQARIDLPGHVASGPNLLDFAVISAQP